MHPVKEGTVTRSGRGWKPPAVRPPAYASASAPRVCPLPKALRLGWSAILDALLICCLPAQPLPLQLPHAVCSGSRSGALVLRPVLLCDPPDGRSALSLPLPSHTATPPAVRASRPIRRRGSAARPDTLLVCISRYARPCSVCPAPCLAVCSRRVLRPAVCSHQTGARRQPPARTTAARLSPAACSAFSTGQGYSAEAARPARACRALCAFASPVALVEWWINLSSLLPGSIACFLRRSLVGKHRNAVPVKGQDERQSRP